MRVPRGFTLVELMVVIAIISILVAMLLPSFQRFHAESRRVRCGTQLDQIGNAFIAYSDNNKDYYPWLLATRSAMVYGGRGGSYPGYRAIDGYGPKQRALNQYVGLTRAVPDNADVPVFRCPDDKGAKVWDPNSVTTYLDVGTSYAFNGWASISGVDTLRGRRQRQVRRPTLTILAGDHTIHNFVGNGNRRQFWHDNSRFMANMLFADSHVAYHEVLPQDVTNDYTWFPWQ
jgi:prepilin-type N-terminal cleavage/methylation domain-containing protein/prepilin-type processing-associated H-X9-DG protein